MRDYYEILGVSRDADTDAIKKAYRKLALKHHPDRNNGSPDSEEKFKEATEAYEVLKDAEKRAAYDRYGHAGLKGGAAAGGFGGFDFGDALEIFMRDFGGFGLDDLFGGGRGRRRRSGPQRGSDVRVRLPLTLQDVAEGVTKTVKLKVSRPCDTCDGTGSEAGGASRCEECGGSGEVRRVQRSILGQFVSVGPCPACDGEGQRIVDPCSACGGSGLERGETSVDVEIPPGVSSGDYLAMRGRGHAGPRGGPNGDVIVVLEVEEDPRFVREGPNLIHRLPITFSQAALGAELEVPTVGGTARITVPQGAQSGQILRMRGKGLPNLKGPGRGDQLVQLVVWTPTELSEEEEELYRRLADLEASPPDDLEEDRQRGGFWSRVKEAFTA